MTAKPVMIMVAPTGARILKQHNPATPISPVDIAAEVVRCANAGASIAHIHARKEDGQPTQDLAVFREIVDRVRERVDIVLQLSLGTIGFTVDQALEPLELQPEMVSFPMRAFNERGGGIPEDVREMARRIKAASVTPELDVAGKPTLDGARQLIELGLVASPACFGVNVKEPATMREGTATVLEMTSGLPADAQWWIAKGGQHSLGLRALAIELGGHVRTGFEDSIRNFDNDDLAPSNASLVERIANLCASLGRPVAKTQDVRTLLRNRSA